MRRLGRDETSDDDCEHDQMDSCVDASQLWARESHSFSAFDKGAGTDGSSAKTHALVAAAVSARC